ncbi:MAG: hypothetical protein WAV00_08960 [Nocardioides sp.]
MRDALLFAGVFFACLVEAVEALTIVLAVGTARDWRSTWQGVAAGLVVLAAVVAVLGPALTTVPIGTLRLVVGSLLLVFGLQWIRKAVLRAGGVKPLHDETRIFAEQHERARVAVSAGRGVVSDWFAFTVAFKGVLLEGLEVAFIVVTFGATQGSLWLAIAAALAAVVLVAAVGVAVRRPLARVPENGLKLAVGTLLTSFGTFWAGEGAGVPWPGGDAAILGLLVLYAAVALVAIAWVQRLSREPEAMVR